MASAAETVERNTLNRLASESFAPRLATTISLIVLGAYLTVQLLNLSDLLLPEHDIVLCAIGEVAIFGLQVLHSSKWFRANHRRWAFVSLPAQAAITYIPVFYLGLAWGGAAGFLLGSILLLVEPAWIAFGVYGAISVASGIVAVTQHLPPSTIAYLVIANALTGLVVYALTRLADLVTDLHALRRELAENAVEQERHRFSRDLHDLLGYSLTAITLKGELAYRLVQVDPARAQQDITTLLGVARQALADVRSVARSYRELPLAAQLTSASSMLESAGIGMRVDSEAIRLAGPLESALATVVREGVTNMMRHSKAENCRIGLSREDDCVVLTIANDGVDESWATLPGRGMIGDGLGGLDNLRGRVTAVGGSLRAYVDDEGWFTLCASVPATLTRQVSIE